MVMNRTRLILHYLSHFCFVFSGQSWSIKSHSLSFLLCFLLFVIPPLFLIVWQIGDCLRTTSVIIAALVASFIGVPGRICDAVASIIATCTILIIAVPLGFELVRAFRHFYDGDTTTPTTKEVPHTGYCRGHQHFHVSMPTPPLGSLGPYNNNNTEGKPQSLIDLWTSIFDLPSLNFVFSLWWRF